MGNVCEQCPIRKKAELCCGIQPETDKYKFFIDQKRKTRFQVCIYLNTDGTCDIYDERPEECRGYGCETWYAQGMQEE
jgi:Fe-S-cluster containining protein